MTKSIILVILLFVSCLVYSQKTLENSFTIKGNSSGFTEQFISESLLKANFEAYRDKEQTVILSFSNGFTVELISAKALAANGISINPDTYEAKPSHAVVRECTLLDSGHIMVAVSPAPGTKYKSTKQ